MNEQARIEEAKHQAEELKQKTIEEEVKRIDAETGNRAQELFQSLRTKEDQYFREQLERAQTERQNEEATLRTFEEEHKRKLTSEIQKKSEERRKEIERRRKETEEQERKHTEDLARVKAEEERLNREIERRLREENDQRRREEMQKRITEEQQRQEEERQERITALIHNAQELFDAGNYELARVEIAKALVNDSSNAIALELESSIKEAQGIKSELPAEEAAPIPEQKKPTRKKSPEPVIAEKTRKPRPMVWGILTGVIIIGIIIILIMQRKPIHLPANIAVFPLTSTVGSIEETVIGSSLAEEISTRLTSVKPLHVFGYSSCYNLFRHAAEPERTAFRLGNMYLLNGTIARENNVVNVGLKLIDSLGSVLWSGQFQKPVSELSDIPTEVSHQLVEVFSLAAADAEGIVNYKKTCTHSDSYLFYLRGLELLHRRTAESYSNAYQLFIEAAQQDPRYAEAFAAAANVQALRMENGWIRGDSIIVQGQHLAQASIKANPFHSGGYIALARFQAMKMDFQSALSYLDSAITYFPNNPESYIERGKILFRMGKYPEAFEQFQTANMLDGANPEILNITASAYQVFGSNKQALRYHETALKFTNDSLRYLVIPFANTILGDPELRFAQNNRVIAACYRLINSNEQDFATLYYVARLRQISGDSDAVSMLIQTERTLQGILREDPKNIPALMYLALTLTRLGRFSEATLIAERAITIDPSDDIIHYRLAQIYSLQMYSQKEQKLDEKKKAEAIKYLKSALSMNYRFDELTSVDFYNMFQQSEFHSLIRQP